MKDVWLQPYLNDWVNKTHRLTHHQMQFCVLQFLQCCCCFGKLLTVCMHICICIYLHMHIDRYLVKAHSSIVNEKSTTQITKKTNIGHFHTSWSQVTPHKLCILQWQTNRSRQRQDTCLYIFRYPNIRIQLYCQGQINMISCSDHTIGPVQNTPLIPIQRYGVAKAVISSFFPPMRVNGWRHWKSLSQITISMYRLEMRSVESWVTK